MRGSALCASIALVLGISGVGQAGAATHPFSDKALMAWKLLQRREYQRAVTVGEDAVAERPNDPVALAVRGTAYQYVGAYDLAMADHDAVLRITPNDPGALTNSCWVRAVANVQLDLALTYCDAAVAKVQRREFAAYDTRGFLHLRRGEFALAIADYDQALKLKSKLAPSLFGRGLAKLRLGDAAEGKTDMATATKLEPAVADNFAERGMRP